MDSENRLKIVQNLDFIATNVSSLTRLLNLLQQESILSQVEVEEIECQQPRYKAGTELAKLICKKDNSAFPVFIRCLNESGNEIIAQKLMIDTIFKETSQQIWFGVTEPNIFYTGRENEMNILEKYCKDCMSKKTFSIVAVTGLGGVGKSELAKNFAKWFYESVGGHCIWIDAETTQSLEQSFTNLAADLKISLKNDLGKEKEFLEIVEEIYKKLFGQKALLVFDNLENYKLPVLKLLISLASKKPPTLLKPFLITTARLCEAKQFFGTRCTIVDLQVLTEYSAMQFFYKSLNVDEHSGNSIHELIEKLCHRLQYYPLAMQQAAAFINERFLYSGTIQEAITVHLNQMEKLSKELLNYKLPHYETMDSVSKTTLLTWRITFDKLQEESEGVAAEIMNVLCFLSSDNIPIQMVINILQKMNRISNLANVDTIFHLIRKYSMINYSGENLISIHRLVQEVTRTELEERGDEFPSILSGIADCMTDMMEADEITYTDLVHVQTVWQNIMEDKEMVEDQEEFLSRICYTLFCSGKYRELIDFCDESEEFVESLLGKNSKLTLRMKYWKGRTLSDLGEYLESIKVLKDVHEKQKELFGEESSRCLNTARGIGYAYYKLNKYDDAMEIYKIALEKSERVFGKESRDRLALQNDMALVLIVQNKLNEAMEMYKEVFEVQERLLGVEHPTTLTTKHNIALLKYRQKDYQGALKEFQEVLEIQENVLELHHPNTLLTKYNIALTLTYLGNHEKSLQWAQEVHENQVQILGPQHPQTIEMQKLIEIVRMQIAFQRFLTSECSSVLREIAECMDSVLKGGNLSLTELANIRIVWQLLCREKQMLEEHGKLFDCIFDTLFSSGQYRYLLFFGTEAEDLVESALGQNSRWSLQMKHWKGLALKELGEYSESLELLQSLCEKQISLFGEEDDDVLLTASDVGLAYWKLEKYEEAMKIFRSALDKRERIFGNEHQKTLDLKINMALMLFEQHKFSEAIQIYKEILEVQERLLGVEDPETLTTKHNIAFANLQLANYEEALDGFEEVLEIRESVLGLNHPHTLITLYCFAKTHYHLEEYKESLELFKEVHEGRVEILGPEHPQTISTEKWIEKVELQIALLIFLTDECFPILIGIAESMLNMIKARDLSLREFVDAHIVWQHLTREKKIPEKQRQLLLWIFLKLDNSGNLTDIVDNNNETVELLDSILGKNSRWALQIKFRKALLDLPDSLQLLKDIGEHQKENFGEADNNYLNTINEIGNLYWRLEAYDEAMEIYITVLAKRELIYGKEHPETLSLKNCVATVLHDQNKFDEAFKLYAEILEVKERVLGMEHFETLTIKHNIASVKLKQKDYGGALKEFQEILEIKGRVLGMNHPSTLITKYHIAEANYHLNRPQESLRLFKEVYEKNVQMLGPLHPESIKTEKWIETVEIEIAQMRSLTYRIAVMTGLCQNRRLPPM